MHPSILDARNQAARQRITAAAAALADGLQLAPLATLRPDERRQPPVRQMRELESLADLLERIAAALVVEAR